MKQIEHPIDNYSTVCIETKDFDKEIYGTIIYRGTANYYFVIPTEKTKYDIAIPLLLANSGTHYLFHNVEEDYEKYFKLYNAWAGFWVHEVAITKVISTNCYTLQELLEQLQYDTNRRFR